MATKVNGVVRVALIGCGGIASAHAKALVANASKIKCVALVDVSQDNLKKRSDELGGVSKQFNDWKVMLKEMRDQVDAVDICLPHHLHAPAILDSVNAGKHVICEKPMCMNLAEADQIAAALSKAGVTYMSAHNQLFMSSVVEAKKMIDAGEIGKLRWLRSQDCFIAGDWFRGTWRGDVKTQGGGELIDTGYHPTYRLLHLAGSPAAAVRGTFGRYHCPLQAEDTAAVQVRFANGAIGEILTSWAFPNPYGSHQIHVMGEKGQIFGSNNVIYHLPNDAKEPTKRELSARDTFESEIEHFADCLREGKRPIHSVQEGRDVLELILKATENARGWQS